MSDLRRFWKQLDQEYFQEIDGESAVNAIEQIIKSLEVSRFGEDICSHKQIALPKQNDTVQPEKSGLTKSRAWKRGMQKDSSGNGARLGFF